MKENFYSRTFFIIIFLACVAGLMAGCGGGKTETPQAQNPGQGGITGVEGNSSSAVSSKVIPPGTICADGGIQIDSGIDDNGNGLLDADEIDNTEYVCNGAPGIEGAPGAAGAQGNDGAPGIEGPPGSSGLTSLVATYPEPAGANCAKIGTRIESGIDDNADSILDPAEVDSTTFVCNGVNGAGGTAGGTGTLTGTVQLAGKNDFSGITVSLSGTGLSAVSDTGGLFSFADIPQGEYDIKFSAPGYASVTLPEYRIFSGIAENLSPLSLGKGVLVTQYQSTTTCYDEFSPDSSFLIYIMPEGGNSLYSVPTAGGQPVKLGSTISDCFGVRISPDSSTIVFEGPQYNLFSVPIEGGTPINLGESNQDSLHTISPDSQFLLFEDPQFNLYTVPLSGGSPVFLGNKGARWGGFRFSPDSSYVVYSNDSDDLYMVSSSGGTPVKLGANVRRWGVRGWGVSPDSASIIFTDRAADDLYLASKTGGAATKLGVGGYNFTISPDSSYVVFKTTPGSDSKLQSVSLTGGTDTVLAAGSFNNYAISPDSSRVVFRDNTGHLFSVSIAGGVPEDLAQGLVYGGTWSFTPDSFRVVYAIGNNLFSVPISGGTSTELGNISGRENSETGQRYMISPDSSKVLYVDSYSNLYSVPVSGGDTTLIGSNIVAVHRRQPWAEPYDDYHYYSTSPDSSVVAFISQTGLHTVPISGGPANVVSSNIDLQENNGWRFGFSPDSRFFLYRDEYLFKNSYYEQNFSNRVLYTVPVP